jgi:flagellum-specific peptidoglycan hydrolase FlgJ
MSSLKIYGNANPVVGKEELYTLNNTPVSLIPGQTTPSTNNPFTQQVDWSIYILENGEWNKAEKNDKTGAKAPYTFTQISLKRKGIKIVAKVGQEQASLIIVPQRPIDRKLINVELCDALGNKATKPFAYGQTVIARVHCLNLDYCTVHVTLWEDDAKGAGHSETNKNNKAVTLPCEIKNGIAEVKFKLQPDFAKMADAIKAKGEKSEGKTHEYYVTAEIFKQKTASSGNVNVTRQDDTVPVAPTKKTPAETKGKSKKEEKGILDSVKDGVHDWWEAVVKVSPIILPDPVEIVNSLVKIFTPEKKEGKFDKVKEKGEEAIIYVTSEIATAIEVDKNGEIVSYPDSGAFNGQEEYKEGDKIYCKKISSTKSAFPTYKTYVYRGNVVGEALKKLKQDLEHKTFKNAESTVLELARHTLSNNKNYLKEGPTPPNSVDKLYRLSYKTATNSKDKVSYRYRIVDLNAANFPVIKDYKKEYQNGAMSLGTRGSISIDPWNSNGLIGCVGIRGSKGVNHPSTKETYSKQDKINYKYIYHSINNYLEGVIPELTGIYGRRGFSTTEGTVKVAASTYDHEVKVYILIDPLPEIDNCNCTLKKDGRETFYKEFGESAIKMVESKNKSNKFKGLYMIAQRRQENGMKLEVPNNNPMNIKDSGDLGKSDLYTREVINGKEIFINDGFGKFSTIEKGFEGYLKLLERNFNDAYSAILDNSKSIDDFLIGMQDKGKNGAYATDPNYKTSIKSIFNGVVKDYEKILDCKLCKAKNEEDKNKIKKDIQLLKELK